MENPENRKAGSCLRPWGTVGWFVLVLRFLKQNVYNLCADKCISLSSEYPKHFPSESSWKMRDLGMAAELWDLQKVANLFGVCLFSDLAQCVTHESHMASHRCCRQETCIRDPKSQVVKHFSPSPQQETHSRRRASTTS